MRLERYSLFLGDTDDSDDDDTDDSGAIYFFRTYI